MYVRMVAWQPSLVSLVHPSIHPSIHVQLGNGIMKVGFGEEGSICQGMAAAEGPELDD
jgi:hypothetical protein